MATPAALFPDGSLDPAYAQLVPTGKTITNPTHVVSLVLSTGETVTIGTVATLMRLFTYMARNQIWHMFPTEDMWIARAGPKLIIGEASFIGQKLASNLWF